MLGLIRESLGRIPGELRRTALDAEALGVGRDLTDLVGAAAAGDVAPDGMLREGERVAVALFNEPAYRETGALIAGALAALLAGAVRDG